MSFETNEALGSSREAPAGTTASFPATRLFFWSIRRELWESRQVYLAPLAVAGVVLAGMLIHTIGRPGKLRALAALDPARLHKAIVMPYDLAAALVMGTTAIVSIFYCLDALQGERRDRSILFWKSLPVSDLTTVLAKASIPIVFMQLASFAITAVMQLVMLLASTAVLGGSGLTAALWTEVAWPRTSLLLFYHLFTVHALWYAPIYAWLILVSAWSRRAAILWAFLPPLAIGVLEKMVFGTSHLKALLESRVMAGMEAVMMPGTMPMDPMTHVTPGRFLTSPGLWIGLAIAGCLLAVAARIRRYRGPV